MTEPTCLDLGWLHHCCTFLAVNTEGIVSPRHKNVCWCKNLVLSVAKSLPKQRLLQHTLSKTHSLYNACQGTNWLHFPALWYNPQNNRERTNQRVHTCAHTLSLHGGRWTEVLQANPQSPAIWQGKAGRAYGVPVGPSSERTPLPFSLQTMIFVQTKQNNTFLKSSSQASELLWF